LRGVEEQEAAEARQREELEARPDTTENPVGGQLTQEEQVRQHAEVVRAVNPEALLRDLSQAEVKIAQLAANLPALQDPSGLPAAVAESQQGLAQLAEHQRAVEDGIRAFEQTLATLRSQPDVNRNLVTMLEHEVERMRTMLANAVATGEELRTQLNSMDDTTNETS
jgi:chromosome segregation ATPase